MKNPLHNELEELRYISISSIDPYDIPESVVIYFKNNSEINKKMSIETIHGTQLDLQNQNPTIVLENYKATFCLGSTPYVPTVTIDPIEDILDPEYPRKITFTGTISRTDNFIPNSILVEYYGITKRASLVDDTNWTVTFDLYEVTVDTTQTVSAIANSIDVNSSVISGYSEIVTSEFNIIFECTPSVDEVSCLCLDTTENYKVTVDNETFSGSFEDVVSFLASHGLYAYPSKTKCNPAPTISCDGATTEAWFTNGSGPFHITVDGEFFENPSNWGVGYMINQIPKLAAILYGEGDGGFRFFNKSPKFLRIKLEPIQSDVWGIKAGNNNPTIDINDDGVIQFCLAPAECNSTAVTFKILQSWNGINESGYEKSIKLYDATTNQLLAFGEAPILEDDGDYSNIIPDFVLNANTGNHDFYVEHYTDSNYDPVLIIRSTASVCRNLRLEVFIGNEGSCRAKTTPDNPNDIVIINPVDYEDYLVTPVKVYFCLCPDTPPQTTLLRLQTSNGNTLFSGVADNLTLINSANQIVYRN